jgi:hypothetical protein
LIRYSVTNGCRIYREAFFSLLIIFGFCFAVNNTHSCPVDILWHYMTAAACHLPGPAQAPAKQAHAWGSMFKGEAF